jgi:signal transduction histidine kinase
MTLVGERSFHSATLDAREDEIRRVANALHDYAGLLATSAQLALDDVRRALPDGGGEAVRRLARCLTLLEEDLRGLSRELRPPALDELGLAPALRSLAADFERRLEIPVRVTASVGARPDPRLEIAAYRIVQESLANVARHARAATVEVVAEQADGRLRVTVRDDGTGFDPGAVRGGRGLGLAAMRERAEALGGRLDVASEPGAGTEIRAVMPLGGAPSPARF